MWRLFGVYRIGQGRRLACVPWGIVDGLIRRIKTRGADPMRAVDSAAWVRPIPKIAPPATAGDVDAAEAASGPPLLLLLRRLFTEVGNGHRGCLLRARWHPNWRRKPEAPHGWGVTRRE